MSDQNVLADAISDSNNKNEEAGFNNESTDIEVGVKSLETDVCRDSNDTNNLDMECDTNIKDSELELNHSTDGILIECIQNSGKDDMRVGEPDPHKDLPEVEVSSKEGEILSEKEGEVSSKRESEVSSEKEYIEDLKSKDSLRKCSDLLTELDTCTGVLEIKEPVTEILPESKISLSIIDDEQSSIGTGHKVQKNSGKRENITQSKSISNVKVQDSFVLLDSGEVSKFIESNTVNNCQEVGLNVDETQIKENNENIKFSESIHENDETLIFNENVDTDGSARLTTPSFDYNGDLTKVENKVTDESSEMITDEIIGDSRWSGKVVENIDYSGRNILESVGLIPSIKQKMVDDDEGDFEGFMDNKENSKGACVKSLHHIKDQINSKLVKAYRLYLSRKSKELTTDSDDGDTNFSDDDDDESTESDSLNSFQNKKNKKMAMKFVVPGFRSPIKNTELSSNNSLPETNCAVEKHFSDSTNTEISKSLKKPKRRKSYLSDSSPGENEKIKPKKCEFNEDSKRVVEERDKKEQKDSSSDDEVLDLVNKRKSVKITKRSKSSIKDEVPRKEDCVSPKSSKDDKAESVVNEPYTKSRSKSRRNKDSSFESKTIQNSLESNKVSDKEGVKSSILNKENHSEKKSKNNISSEESIKIEPPLEEALLKPDKEEVMDFSVLKDTKRIDDEKFENDENVNPKQELKKGRRGKINPINESQDKVKREIKLGELFELQDSTKDKTDCIGISKEIKEVSKKVVEVDLDQNSNTYQIEQDLNITNKKSPTKKSRRKRSKSFISDSEHDDHLQGSATKRGGVAEDEKYSKNEHKENTSDEENKNEVNQGNKAKKIDKVNIVENNLKDDNRENQIVKNQIKSIKKESSKRKKAISFSEEDSEQEISEGVLDKKSEGYSSEVGNLQDDEDDIGVKSLKIKSAKKVSPRKKSLIYSDEDSDEEIFLKNSPLKKADKSPLSNFSPSKSKTKNNVQNSDKSDNVDEIFISNTNFVEDGDLKPLSDVESSKGEQSSNSESSDDESDSEDKNNETEYVSILETILVKFTRQVFVGLNYILEFQKGEKIFNECSYYCGLCKKSLVAYSIVSHLKNNSHKLKLMNNLFPSLFKYFENQIDEKQTEFDEYTKKILTCIGQKNVEIVQPENRELAIKLIISEVENAKQETFFDSIPIPISTEKEVDECKKAIKDVLPSESDEIKKTEKLQTEGNNDEESGENKEEKSRLKNQNSVDDRKEIEQPEKNKAMEMDIMANMSIYQLLAKKRAAAKEGTTDAPNASTKTKVDNSENKINRNMVDENKSLSNDEKRKRNEDDSEGKVSEKKMKVEEKNAVDIPARKKFNRSLLNLFRKLSDFPLQLGYINAAVNSLLDLTILREKEGKYTDAIFNHVEDFNFIRICKAKLGRCQESNTNIKNAMSECSSFLSLHEMKIIPSKTGSDVKMDWNSTWTDRNRSQSRDNSSFKDRNYDASERGSKRIPKLSSKYQNHSQSGAELSKEFKNDNLSDMVPQFTSKFSKQKEYDDNERGNSNSWNSHRDNRKFNSNRDDYKKGGFKRRDDAEIFADVKNDDPSNIVPQFTSKFSRKKEFEGNERRGSNSWNSHRDNKKFNNNHDDRQKGGFQKRDGEEISNEVKKDDHANIVPQFTSKFSRQKEFDNNENEQFSWDSLRDNETFNQSGEDQKKGGFQKRDGNENSREWKNNRGAGNRGNSNRGRDDRDKGRDNRNRGRDDGSKFSRWENSDRNKDDFSRKFSRKRNNDEDKYTNNRNKFGKFAAEDKTNDTFVENPWLMSVSTMFTDVNLQSEATKANEGNLSDIKLGTEHNTEENIQSKNQLQNVDHNDNFSQSENERTFRSAGVKNKKSKYSSKWDDFTPTSDTSSKQNLYSKNNLNPIKNWQSAPIGNLQSTPLTNWQQAPVNNWQPPPVNCSQSAPVNNWQQPPVNNWQPPAVNYSQPPPVNNWQQLPVDNLQMPLVNSNNKQPISNTPHNYQQSHGNNSSKSEIRNHEHNEENQININTFKAKDYSKPPESAFGTGTQFPKSTNYDQSSEHAFGSNAGHSMPETKANAWLAGLQQDLPSPIGFDAPSAVPTFEPTNSTKVAVAIPPPPPNPTAMINFSEMDSDIF